MRILPLIAASAFALASVASAQAGDGRSLSLAGVDGKIPTALGKAAETPKVVEAPKPPDPPRPPDPPKAAETPAAAPAPAEAPAYAPRPSIVGAKPDANKAGQVTFDDKSATTTAPAQSGAPATTPLVTAEKPKQTARSEKPRRNRGHWNEARIMREISRYSGYAGMIGGW